MKNIIYFIGLSIIVSSCFDLYERNKIIIEPYYVATDPESDCKTLYYKTKDNLCFERIRCVEKAGYVNDFIIIKTSDKFQYFKISNDKPSDLGDSEVQKNISRQLNKVEFQNFLDSLKITDFKFIYER